MITKDDIKEWIDNAPQGSTHMIVVYDTFCLEDYPVYVNKRDNVKAIESRFTERNMQRIMEVYNLKKGLKKQLNSTIPNFKHVFYLDF